MKWVTRERPKIDRVACPWLIARFVDRDPTFLFVAPGDVLRVAATAGAIPFDVEGVELTHDGPRCSFDAILTKYELDGDPALADLATIVRGADTDRLDLAPQCAGLLAVSLGLSRNFRDDLAQLEAAMGIYDAFYRWCRDATEETHNWPNPKPGA